MSGRSLVLGLFLVLFGALFVAQASAQSSVVVLGVRSVEGDDDVAHDLTTALREGAQDVSQWNVSPTAVSMAQMALAHGCEEVDVACLADIAKGLSADLVVYGTLRRNSAREDFDFAFNLSLFNAQSGSIQNSVDDTIVRRDTTKGALAPRAKRLIARLAGAEVQEPSGDTTLGSIVVRANIDSGDVLINEQPVGTLAGGILQYDGLQAGMYRVEIRAHGYSSFVKTVRVNEGERVDIEAEMQVGASGSDASLDWEDEPVQQDGGHGLRWLGWTLVGVGAVAAAGLVVSWTQIVRINNDDRLERYSGDVAAGNQLELGKARSENREPELYDDFCVPASQGIPYSFVPTPEKFKEVQGLCDAADTWEMLQYVFLGTAVAAGGTGVVLLLTAGSGHSDSATAEPPRFALTPQLSPDRAGLHATFTF
jgi:hypothetical protein